MASYCHFAPLMAIFSGLVLSAAFGKAMRTMPFSNVASAWGVATMAGIVGGVPPPVDESR
jgi:hypothetical protein